MSNEEHELDKSALARGMTKLSLFVAAVTLPILAVVFVIANVLGHLLAAVQHGWHYSLFDTHNKD